MIEIKYARFQANAKWHGCDFLVDSKWLRSWGPTRQAAEERMYEILESVLGHANYVLIPIGTKVFAKEP